MPDNFVPYDPANPPQHVPCPAPDVSSSEVSGGAFDIPDFPKSCVDENGNLPLVGSPQWCKCIGDVQSWVSKIGDAAFDWLMPEKPAENTEDSFWSGILRSLSIPGIVGAVRDSIPKVLDKTSEKVRNLYHTAKLILTKSNVCNPAVIMGCEILRTLLGSLSRLRAGSNAVLWITVDLSFTIRVIDQILHYVENYACPVNIPELSSVHSIYLHTHVSDELVRCWSRLHGYDWDVNFLSVYAERRQPEVQELFRIRNREIIDERTLDRQLVTLGFIDHAEREPLRALRFEVPGPSDLVRFAVRHVFEPDLLAKFGFNDERDKGAFRLDAYHHTAGLDYPIFTGPLSQVVAAVTGLAPDALAADYTSRGLPEPTWAHAYWWSHWVLPPQTWAAQARFRLDETRDTSLEPKFMKDLQFTEQDYDDLLRMNDYPPWFRKKMLALSFNPVSPRFLRVLVADNALTRDQVAQNLRATGMLPIVAEKYADALIADVEDKQNPVRSLEHGRHLRVFKSIMKAYKIGVLTRNAAFDRCIELGLTADATETYLDTLDADLYADFVSRAIRAIRKDYMDGAIAIDVAQQLLARLLIADARAQQYLSLWQFERNLTVKMAGTGQLLSWYSSGIIDQSTLFLRLANLGWIQPDLLAYMAEGQQRLQRREAAVQAAAMRSVRANSRIIEQQLKDAQKQVNELRAELKRLTPPGKLIKWARQGTITGVYFEERLRLLGYPENIIADYWQEVLKSGPLKDKSANWNPPSATDGTAAASQSEATGGQTQGVAESVSPTATPGTTSPTR